ncbi:AfsR/SARP family transcriptional regulator [Nocardia sp. CA-128927]|uniref:AfsR/SARP family transcriptional regulator n=1 Tax=Nocardia sp. CA-128927 TaxID=3239975 RepID=UPI003D966D9D
MLIAITGVGLRTGVTTAAVAMAAAWPGPEPAVLVEADPHGGHLADHVGNRIGLGLARLAAAARTGPYGLAQLVEHAQLLPTGVPVITAPTLAERARAMLAAAARRPRVPEDADLVVIADCGRAHPCSAAMPIMRGADALIVLVRAEDTDHGLAARRINEIGGWNTRARAVVVVGSDPAGESMADLGVPVMGRLPRDPRGANAILHADKVSRHSGALGAAAREITVALRAQLVAEVAHRSEQHRSGQWWRGRRTSGDLMPTVYRLQGLSSIPQRSDVAEPNTMRACHQSLKSAGNDTEPDNVARSVSVRGSHPRGTGQMSPQKPAPTNNPGAPATTLTVNVFGPLRVTWHPGPGCAEGVDITGKLQRRGRELLTLLAVHPDGVTRTALIDALWGEQGPARPANTINTTVNRLRAALLAATDGTAAEVICDDRILYRLNPARVSVDYRRFIEAVHSRRQADCDQARVTAYEQIIDVASGTLAEDLHTTWVEPIREAARRDAVNALAALAQMLVADDPRRTLDLLETAVTTDPHNEQIYRDILRLHARLGQYDAIARTMALLTRRLTEIGEQPSLETRAVAQRLQHAKDH